MRASILAIALGLVALHSGTADAGDGKRKDHGKKSQQDAKAEAREHVAKADTSYKLGEFDAALDEYSKAYELYPVPALLFNIGQCHRELGHYDKALFFYEGFLRDAPADASNRAVVEALANDMRDAIAKQQADQAAQAKADRDARDAEEAEAARLREDARQRAEEDRRVADARTATTKPGRGKRVYQKWWFWTAVGGAALAAGGTTYFLATDVTFVPPMGTLGTLDRR